MGKRGIFLLLLSLASNTAVFGQGNHVTFSVYFESGQSTPYDSGMNAALKNMKAIGGRVVMVYGYADSVGARKTNLKLSKDRCMSVIKILKASGKSSSIEFEARGELNTTGNESLAASRRVDIDVSYNSPLKKVDQVEWREQIYHLDLDDIQFLPDLPAFEPASLLYLPEVLSILKKIPHAHYDIVGYVNWITNHPENKNSGYAKKMQELSEGRARSVYEWLADNGIDKSRMTYAGKSNDSLIFSNPKTDEEKERNMRVRIIIRDSVKY